MARGRASDVVRTEFIRTIRYAATADPSGQIGHFHEIVGMPKSKAAQRKKRGTPDASITRLGDLLDAVR
jgi:hypothetical protein